MTLLGTLKMAGVRFFTGVPDSTLKAFCWSLERDSEIIHIRAVSEGSAVGLAVGHAISTGEIPCVYMQNSGLLNAAGPLMSLAGEHVFDAPMLLIIGWRGKPGRPDEPQHLWVGEHTPDLLAMLGIRTYLLTNDNLHGALAYIETLSKSRRGAILVSPEVKLCDVKQQPPFSLQFTCNALPKSTALAEIVKFMDPKDIVVSGIGHTSRQLLQLRRRIGQDETRDLWCVGGMGIATSVAIGICLNSGGRRVYCLDGDGSFLMHGLANSVVRSLGSRSYIHILFENGLHASVGGQPIAASVDFTKIGLALGYTGNLRSDTLDELRKALLQARDTSGPVLIRVPVAHGDDGVLPRPEIPIPDAVSRFQHYHGFNQ